jgi:hypothetical protein
MGIPPRGSKLTVDTYNKESYRNASDGDFLQAVMALTSTGGGAG